MFSPFLNPVVKVDQRVCLVLWLVMHVFSSSLPVASVFTHIQIHRARTGVLTPVPRLQLMGECVVSLVEKTHLECVLFFRSGASISVLWDLITISLSPLIRGARPLGPNANSPQRPVHFINKPLPDSYAYTLGALVLWCNEGQTYDNGFNAVF